MGHKIKSSRPIVQVMEKPVEKTKSLSAQTSLEYKIR